MMNKVLVLICSVVFIIGSVHAQEKRPEKPQHVTYEQMTTQMTKELQLNEKQQKKVAKLNKKYKQLIEGERNRPSADRRPPMEGKPNGNRGVEHGGGMPGGGMRGQGGGFGGGMHGGPRGDIPTGQRQANAYDYDKKQEKYDKKIEKLFTPDQYEGYKKLKKQFFSQRRYRNFLLGGQLKMEGEQ